MSQPFSQPKLISRSNPKYSPHLTPKQAAIHQQTINRHLSTHKAGSPQLINFETNYNDKNIKAFQKSSNITIPTSQIDNDEKKVQDNPFLAQSHSVLGDLPDFKQSPSSKSKSNLRKNKSTPTLSSMQQQKLQNQVYMAPSQIPRSLSMSFANYQPNQPLLMLMDLPTEAFMGIGGGLKKSLSQRLNQLKQQLQRDYDDADDDKADYDISAVPAAPSNIPPTSIENDISVNNNKFKDDNVSSLPAPPSPIPDDIINIPDPQKQHQKQKQKQKQPSDGLNIQRRHHSEAIAHDIEQTLKQGYTRNLIIAIIQGIIGAFLYGWNVSILNVPENIIRDQTGLSKNAYAALQSTFCAGGLVGALIAGPMVDKIGRKMGFIIVDFIFIISAIINYLWAVGVFGDIDDSSNYWYFYAGRFFAGLACGASTAVVPTYLGEISPALIRGAVGTFNQLTICFGVVIVEIVGYKDIIGGKNSFQYLFIGNALPIIQLLTLWTFPESPKWLIQKGRDDDAKKSLQRLRQTNDVRIDMLLMKGGVLHEEKPFVSPHVRSPKPRRKQKNQNNKKSPLLNDIGPTTNLPPNIPVINDIEYGTTQYSGANSAGSVEQPTLKSPFRNNSSSSITPQLKKAIIWASIIAVVLMLMQQFSGINTVFYYSSTILDKAGLKSDFQQWLGSWLIGLANFFAVFIAVATVDRAGRKKLLILSCIIMIIASLLVSLSLMLESHGKVWQYSSIGYLVLFVVGFECGLGAIPWLMMAELAPIEYRGPIVSLATFANWGSNLMIAQFSGPIIDNVYFFPFAVVCALGIIFTLKYIPETNGKTAAQIQKELISM